MTEFTNIGAAFPLEKLGSDIARNEFNYQSILNGLIEWDKSQEDTVTIRLTKDSDPYYEDYTIPTKFKVFDLNSIECDVEGSIPANAFPTTAINSTLYGGGFVFETTTFDGASPLPDTDKITLTSASGFFPNDHILFETNGATLPTGPNGLLDTKQYIIKGVAGNDIQLLEADNITSVNMTLPGSGTITVVKVDPESDTDDPGDIATMRITVTNNGNAEWELSYYQLITAWTEDGTYKYGALVNYNNILYKVISNVSGLPVVNTPAADTAHYEKFINEWILGAAVKYDALIYHEGILYRALQEISASKSQTSEEDANLTPPQGIPVNLYEVYAEKYVHGDDYIYGGEYVFYAGNPYIAKKPIKNSTKYPNVDTDNWELAVIRPVTVASTIKESTIVRWYLDVDVYKFILRNISSNLSESDTDINLKLSIKTKGHASIYQKSVDIISTSNYSFWPSDQTTIWDVAKPITEGSDVDKDITERQNYSAVMVFDHTNAAIAKTVNYINYDGPDLDQGLCIYLPVEAPVGETEAAAPEDGFTYEFFFRIWPNTQLTGDITRDHIINKSHIYVYSAPTLEDIQNNTCGEPIAKFSMARVTNFYVFGENIAIPDKPVCYRATFIYSEIEGKWITLDYYQLPDHIFMGPIGFIDPRNPANLDINNSIIGDINPNAAHVGYETGYFPLFQDPFSNPDLSPYRDSDYDSFKNRLA